MQCSLRPICLGQHFIRAIACVGLLEVSQDAKTRIVPNGSRGPNPGR